MTEPTWQFELVALCLTPDGAAVWLHDSAAGPTLPQTTVSAAGWWALEAGALAVAAALSALLATPATPLRVVQQTLDEEAKTGCIIYEVEPEGPAGRRLWPLADGRPPASAPEAWAFVTEIGRELAAAAIPAARPPWQRRGWHTQAHAWLRAQAVAAGHTVTAIQTRRSWALGCVLAATTADGQTLYMKAPVTTALFANEAAVVAALARYLPDYVLTPLAIDRARRWLLLPSVGSMAYEALNEQTAPALRVAAVERHARAQIAALEHVPALLAAGCTDRRWETFDRQIRALCRADLARFGVTAEEQAQLAALESDLLARSAALAAGPIPCTLLHGDLHFGNLAYDGERFMAIDWTDAAIAFPFFDMLLIFWASDPARQVAARDAYLACWAAFAPADRLLTLWELARPLFFAYHIVSYHAILEALEPSAHGDLADTLEALIDELLKLQIAT